jgi:hypothetical protein
MVLHLGFSGRQDAIKVSFPGPAGACTVMIRFKMLAIWPRSSFANPSRKAWCQERWRTTTILLPLLKSTVRSSPFHLVQGLAAWIYSFPAFATASLVKLWHVLDGIFM